MCDENVEDFGLRKSSIRILKQLNYYGVHLIDLHTKGLRNTHPIVTN